MNMERTCMMCGKQYKFCGHCNDFDPSESWKYLYHDEKCMDISKVWYAYRGKEITKDEAKSLMKKITPNIDDVLKYTSIPAMEIREIFGVVEIKPEAKEQIEESVEVDVETKDVKDENIEEKEEHRSNNKHNSYKNKK